MKLTALCCVASALLLAGVAVFVASGAEPDVVAVQEVPVVMVVEPESEPETKVMGHFRVTAYCTCPKCCKKWSKYKRTATGIPARAADRIIAVDPRVIPLHSQVWVEGMGWFQAEDKGKLIKGKRLDILMATHYRARRFGAQRRNITVMLPEDG
jgi:3D (Asp-Asp-Asp) domain-containing protein